MQIASFLLHKLTDRWLNSYFCFDQEQQNAKSANNQSSARQVELRTQPKQKLFLALWRPLFEVCMIEYVSK